MKFAELFVFWGFFSLLPILYGLERLPLGIGAPSFYVDMFLYVTAAVIAAINLIRRGIRCNLNVSVNNKFIVFLISLFIIALILAHIFDNSNIDWTRMGVQRLLLPIVFFIFTLSLPGGRLKKITERGLPVFTVTCFVISIIGIVEYFILKMAFSQLDLLNNSFLKLRAIRIGSVFASPLFLGVVLYYGMIANIWWLLKRPFNPFLIIMLITNGTALWFTFSRGPVAIILFFFALYILFSSRSSIQQLNYLGFALAAVIITVVLWGFLSSNSIFGFFTSSLNFDEEASNALRVQFWVRSVEEIFRNSKNFIWGYGIGRVGAVPTLQNFPGGFPPESCILFLWLELGFIGLLGYLSIGGTVLVESLKKIFQPESVNFKKIPTIAAIAFIAIIPEVLILQFIEADYLANLMWLNAALCLVDPTD